MTAQTPDQDSTSWGTVFAGAFAGIAAAIQFGKAAATLPLIRAEFASGLTLLSV